MELIFRSVDGFQSIQRRRRSEYEEIDLLIQTDPNDTFWGRESRYILVECKNWSRCVDPKELVHFYSKLEGRYGRAKLGFFVAPGGFTEGRALGTPRTSGQLGFFVAPGGFTEGFQSALDAKRERDILVVCIGPESLAALVTARDRDELLKQLHAGAVIGANGNH